MPSRLSPESKARLSEAANKVLTRYYIRQREAAQRPIMAAAAKGVATVFILQGNRLLELMEAHKNILVMGEEGAESFDPGVLDSLMDQAFASTNKRFIASVRPHIEAGLSTGWQFGAKQHLKPLKRSRLKEAATTPEDYTPHSFSLSNPRAVRYIEEHGATMVSRVNDTTRQQIHDIVAEAAKNGQSYQTTAKQIKDRFSEFAVPKPQKHIANRATLVAVTEVGQAYEDGVSQVGEWLESYGLPMVKFWQTVEDQRVSSGCSENEGAGWIAMRDVFPSGHMSPLRFPGCRCAVLTRLYDPTDMGEVPGMVLPEMDLDLLNSIIRTLADVSNGGRGLLGTESQMSREDAISVIEGDLRLAGRDPKLAEQIYDDLQEYAGGFGYGSTRAAQQGVVDDALYKSLGTTRKAALARAERIEDYIDAAPKFTGQVWRGVAGTDGNVPGMSRLTPDDIKRAIAARKPLDLGGMTSWSASQNIATQFANREFELNDGTSATVYPFLFKAKNISQAAGVTHGVGPWQQEVLVSKDVVLVPVKMTQQGQYWVVELEEVVKKARK